MKRVNVRVPVACSRERVAKDRVQANVLPFTHCTGIDVRCVGNILKFTAICPSNETGYFRRLIISEMKPPLLVGKRLSGVTYNHSYDARTNSIWKCKSADPYPWDCNSGVEHAHLAVVKGMSEAHGSKDNADVTSALSEARKKCWKGDTYSKEPEKRVKAKEACLRGVDRYAGYLRQIRPGLDGRRKR